MKNNEELKKTYNKIAKEWNGDHIVDTWWFTGSDKFLSLLPHGASILDIGCAGGYKTSYINSKGFDVEGVDFFEEMIKEAKEKFKDINFRVLDVYDLDSLNKTYDGIYCQAMLLHVPKKDIFSILEKMKNKLKNDGFLYITVKEKRENGADEEIKKENDYGYEYKRFFSYFDIDELKNHFNNLGMKVVYEDVVSSGRANWINLIAQK